MSNTSYPFGWNWNSGLSAQNINPIGSVPPRSGLGYLGGRNVSDGLPFLGGTNPLRIYRLHRGGHVSSGVPFPGNVNVPRRYPLP